MINASLISSIAATTPGEGKKETPNQSASQRKIWILARGRRKQKKKKLTLEFRLSYPVREICKHSKRALHIWIEDSAVAIVGISEDIHVLWQLRRVQWVLKVLAEMRCRIHLLKSANLRAADGDRVIPVNFAFAATVIKAILRSRLCGGCGEE